MNGLALNGSCGDHALGELDCLPGHPADSPKNADAKLIELEPA